MSTPAAATPVIAGVGVRLGAFAIDVAGIALCTIVIAVGLIFSGLATPGTLDGDGHGRALIHAGALAAGIVPLVALVLYAVLTGRRGASVGQRILNLQVVSLDSHRPVGMGGGMLRTTVLFAPALLVLALRLAAALLAPLTGGVLGPNAWGGGVIAALTWVIPLWWILLAAQLATGRRALHDRAASTMVLAFRARR